MLDCGSRKFVHVDSVALTRLAGIVSGHGKLGEIDSEGGGFLVSRTARFGFGEYGIAPAIGGVATEFKTAAVHGWRSAVLDVVFENCRWLAESSGDRAASNDSGLAEEPVQKVLGASVSANEAWTTAN
jgi:hypothetical protein